MRARIAPSILAADAGRLAQEVRAATEGGGDWIHVDVMDGHFVPNLTFGPRIVGAVRRATDLPVDVHLMIEQPHRHLGAFAEAGADRITVHQEVCPHLHRTVQRIRELGVRPGVAVNPGTPVETLAEVVPYLDLILVMTVNPGFGGQEFIPTSYAKIERTRALIEREGDGDVELEVDGGVGPANAADLVRAGATALVAGTAIFGSPAGVREAIAGIRSALQEGD